MLCQTIAKIWVNVVLNANAASKQTLIVSGSPSNPMLGGGDLNAMPDHPEVLNKNRVLEAKQNFTGEAKKQHLLFLAQLNDFSAMF